ncbi:MAG: sodium:proton antiporter NhaD [Muribaculaceae bacterium]|nr:sodium:proton antiporter NhaD [Muribaculaceae bacterium]MDE6009338.1 sodium:proton antiporter NhaD [Muribaculaceae bacterium]MDE6791818.1 sodium:proton antiporter NhaD [Muribaculaceae bacterium]
MIATLLVIFIVGYLLIASEHVLHVNKATFALIMCGLLWAIYAVCSHDPNITHEMVLALGDTCEIVVFLIGAMTIVELIDRYGGFHMMVEKIHASNKRKLMWILALVAFFLSAVLDNMTTTIIMVMMLRRMLTDQKERWIFACVIVLSANAGGAWSPIGDITTIMLWMKNYVSSVDLIVNLLAPSIISVIVPVLMATYMIPATAVEPLNEHDQRKGYRLSDHHPNLSILILICGVAGLLFVPVFKATTHLAPYMGILLSLGALWLLTELLVRHYKLDGKIEGRVSQVIGKIDMPTILFFLGILMAVAALSQAGILGELAAWLNETFHNVYIINGIIGVLSSIVDNVPLVAACMEMYPVANDAMIAASVDPAYTALFIEDGLFWHLLTFCAGVGGSMLIIGSAAGVVAMGIEKIPFMWYVKRITLLAFSGYLAGMAVIWFEDVFLHL